MIPIVWGSQDRKTDMFCIFPFSSASQSCPILCNPTNCSTPGLPVHRQLPEFTQTHVHSAGDATQPSHPLSCPSPAFNLSQHQGLFQWVSSSHQVAKVLELPLQHQSFQWIFNIQDWFPLAMPNCGPKILIYQEGMAWPSDSPPAHAPS